MSRNKAERPRFPRKEECGLGVLTIQDGLYIMSGAQLRGMLIKPGKARDRPWNAYVYCELE